MYNTTTRGRRVLGIIRLEEVRGDWQGWRMLEESDAAMQHDGMGCTAPQQMHDFGGDSQLAGCTIYL